MRILIVEDDPIIAFVAASTLHEAGHEVIGPFDRAAEVYREAPNAELALVDINLAGHDEGVEIARELKRRFGVKSLFVSGQTSAALANRDAAIGLLKKPYDTQSLLEAIPVAEKIVKGGTVPPPRVPRNVELFTGSK